MDFRENLTRIRLERHMTQMDLAMLLGVELEAVVQWENGDSEPPLKDLVAISDALQRKAQRKAQRMQSFAHAAAGKSRAVCACPASFRHPAISPKDRSTPSRLWVYTVPITMIRNCS